MERVICPSCILAFGSCPICAAAPFRSSVSVLFGVMIMSRVATGVRFASSPLSCAALGGVQHRSSVYLVRLALCSERLAMPFMLRHNFRNKEVSLAERISE